MVGTIFQAQNTSDPLSNTKTYEPAQIQVGDNDLVSGQISKLLRDDNPILQQARTYAKQQANRTGTLNSSMTDGAIFGAMVDRALPIASQDAGTNFTANQYNTDSQNMAYRHAADTYNQGESQLYQGKLQTDLQANDQGWRSGENALDRSLQEVMQQRDYQHQSSENALNREFTSGESALDRTHQASMQDDQQHFTSGQAAIDRQHQEDMMRLEQSWREAMQNDEQSFQAAQNELQRALQRRELDDRTQAIILQSRQDAINSILSDPNLTPEARRGAIQNVMNGIDSTVDFLEGLQNSATNEAQSTVKTMFQVSAAVLREGATDVSSWTTLGNIVDVARATGISLDELADIARETQPQYTKAQMLAVLGPIWNGEIKAENFYQNNNAGSANNTTNANNTGDTGNTGNTRSVASDTDSGGNGNTNAGGGGGGNSGFAVDGQDDQVTFIDTDDERAVQSMIEEHQARDASTSGGSAASPTELRAAVQGLKNAGWTAWQIAAHAASMYGGNAGHYINQIEQYY